MKIDTTKREQFDTTGRVLDEIRAIYADPDPDLSTRLIRELIVHALKCRRDELEVLDLKVLSRSMAEFRYAARIFKPYRHKRKVSIFGSARTPEEDPYYKMAVEFARQLAANHFMVITGAAEGIMKAGNVGAGAENSFGVNILLPFEQSANPVIVDDPKLITFKYFFTRKLTFLRHSDAIVLFPGGFGTMDEGYEALTLMQTGKSRIMPLVLMDREGGAYWRTWDKHIREHLLRNQFISPDDLHLYHVTDDTNEAVRLITRFYRNYHSMRFVHELLVIRLKHPPSQYAIDGLNEDFKDIISGEKIHIIEPTPEEREDNQYLELPRIAFGFNRRDYGRLRQLIDVLNSF